MLIMANLGTDHCEARTMRCRTFPGLHHEKLRAGFNRRHRVLFFVLVFIIPRKAKRDRFRLVGELLRLMFILHKSFAARQNGPNRSANVGNQGP